ncbi:MAG: phosphatase PAP2 family protein [Armatimonadota bacterium]
MIYTTNTNKRRRRGAFALCLVAGAALAVNFGCGGSGVAFVKVSGAEPTAGTWLAIVLTNFSAASVPAPPAYQTPTWQAEISELQQLQASRTQQQIDRAIFWNAGAVCRWNEIARDLVAARSVNPPVASRIYAALSIAQYDTLIAVWRMKYRYNRKYPSEEAGSGIDAVLPIPPDPCYPCEHSAMAAASERILREFFPNDTAMLDAAKSEHQQSRMWAGIARRSDVEAGDQIGVVVAEEVLAYITDDGWDAVWTGQVPVGDCYWYSSQNPPRPPLLPLWGEVRPWLMTSGSQFRPGPPPDCNSQEFQEALQEVRFFSDNRTPEQLAIAMFWADGPGTATPPGHWNQIACDMAMEKGLNEVRTARMLALMNMATMDAGISVWDAKYVYWLIRPSQADPNITTPPGLPNFPSYTSGHSGFSGAAATVLSYIFPGEAETLNAMAEEAAISRVYGGIHYRFDSDVALEQGRQIGALAVARGQADGSP